MTFKKAAFTLSEVLITMTIVGAVAALTIPTLHYQRIKKEYTAKLKNFYSKINNAILDMELDKGSFRDMKIPTQGQGYNWYIENIDPYLGHAYVNDDKKEVYYKDGSKLTTFYTGGCLDVIYDVNGDKSPNQEGYDRYRFLFCFDDSNRQSWFGNKDIFYLDLFLFDEKEKEIERAFKIVEHRRIVDDRFKIFGNVLRHYRINPQSV